MRRRAVVYAPAAADDLDCIYDVVATSSSPAVAEHYEQRIRHFCGRLEYGAERGTLRSDLRPGLRIVGFERRVSIAFAVEDDRVLILRVFYGGRDWEGEFQ